MNDKGVVYIAVDPNTSPSPAKFNGSKKSILADVLRSVNSLRRSNPELPITIFSDYKEIISSPEGYEVIEINNDYGFLPKVLGMLNSPYEKTLFLDCDTYVSQDVSELFLRLDSFDICVSSEFLNPEIRNTGVIAFNGKSTSVNKFVKEWYKSMIKTKHKAIHSNSLLHNKTPDDQGHFNNLYKLSHKPTDGKPKRIVDLINLSKSVSFDILDSRIWNCRNAQYQSLKDDNWDFSKTKIFHMRGFNP